MSKKKNIRKNKNIDTAKQEVIVPRISINYIAALMLVWLFIVLKSYFDKNPIDSSVFTTYFSLNGYSIYQGVGTLSLILSYLQTILYTAMIFLAAYAAGKPLLGLFKFDDITFTERILLSILLGLGVVICAVFLLGVSGFLYRIPVVVLIILLSLYGLTNLSKPDIKFRTLSKSLSGFEKIWLFVSSLFSVLILICCFSPETFYDSLVYHIAKPNIWIQNHKIMPDESMSISGFFPGYMNVIYAIGLFFKDETVCKCTHFVFNILTCTVIYAMGKRFYSHAAGFIGAIIFFTIPYTGMISYRSAVEMPLAFFETTAVFMFIMWLVKKDTRYLVLSGISCGLGLGTKYTTLYCFCAIVFSMMIETLFDRKPLKPLIKSMIIFTMTSFGVSLLWWIYNYAYTGNPLYPYFSKLIGSSLNHRINNEPVDLLTSSQHWIKSIKAIIRSPWTISMGLAEEAFLGPLILLFLPLCMFFKNKFKYIRTVFVYVFVYWIIWGVMHGMYFRYFMPAVPMLCFISGVYISEARFSSFYKKILYFVITVIMFRNIALVMQIQKFSNNCLGLVLGQQSKQEYLDKTRPTYPNPYYDMAEWINKNLPKDSLIAFLGEMRTFGVERRVILCDFSNYIPILTWSGEAKDGDDLYRKVKEKNVTHIFLSVPEARRLTSLDLINFEPKQLVNFSQFWSKYVKEIHRTISDNEILSKGIYSLRLQEPEYWQKHKKNPANYVYLYEILSEDEADKPHQPPFNFFLTPYVHSKDRWERLESSMKDGNSLLE